MTWNTRYCGNNCIIQHANNDEYHCQSPFHLGLNLCIFIILFLCSCYRSCVILLLCSRFFINDCILLFAIYGTVSTYDYDNRKTAYMFGMESIKSAFNGKKSTIMYNQCLEADEILKEYDDVDNLRLDHILDPDEMEDEISCINPSPYYDTSKLPTFLKDEGHFNAQSINAKFDGLLLLLELAKKQYIYFHAICIQESWETDDSDLSSFQITGYQCISQGKICSSHGGLITYIAENYLATSINVNNTSQIWEGQFIFVKDIECNNEIVIGSIYRPPYGNNGKENFQIYPTQTEIWWLLAILIINLLHINLANKEYFGEFVDLMLGLSLFPKITFPWRIGNNGSCTLIDNAYWKLSAKSSGRGGRRGFTCNT